MSQAPTQRLLVRLGVKRFRQDDNTSPELASDGLVDSSANQQPRFPTRQTRDRPQQLCARMAGRSSSGDQPCQADDACQPCAQHHGSSNHVADNDHGVVLCRPVDACRLRRPNRRRYGNSRCRLRCNFSKSNRTAFARVVLKVRLASISRTRKRRGLPSWLAGRCLEHTIGITNVIVGIRRDAHLVL